MTKGPLFLLSFVVLSAAQFGSSDAQLSTDKLSRWIKVTNNSGIEALQIYILPSDLKCCWSGNLLENRTLPPKGKALTAARNNHLNVNFDDGNDQCTYDIRITNKYRAWDWLLPEMDVCSHNRANAKEIILEGEVPISKDTLDRRMYLINESSYPSDHVFIVPSPPGSSDPAESRKQQARPHQARNWSPDLLGFQILKGSEPRILDFDDGTGACEFDIRVLSADYRTVWNFYRIDVCFQISITLKDPRPPSLGHSQFRQMRVANRAAFVAHSIYMISSSQDCCWSKDLLGASMLSTGAATTIEFETLGECLFDVKVTRADKGRDWRLEKLDVCSVDQLTIK
jgi:hypothetical protein